MVQFSKHIKFNIDLKPGNHWILGRIIECLYLQCFYQKENRPQTAFNETGNDCRLQIEVCPSWGNTVLKFLEVWVSFDDK